MAVEGQWIRARRYYTQIITVVTVESSQDSIAESTFCRIYLPQDIPNIYHGKERKISAELCCPNILLSCW
jgi:hypothetical protein